MRQDPSESSRGGLSVLAAVTLIAALWVAALITHTPPSPTRIAAPAQFSSERALAVLQNLVGDSIPHPTGSAANANVHDRIVATLRRLGYEPELQSNDFGCDIDAACGFPQNIVVRIPGTQDDSGSVLLAAHYDSVPAGPGASDDGTSVAVILEIARILKTVPHARHPIVLLIDDGEELGLLGAQVFVEHHPLARTIKAVINIDNRGTSGPSLMFETGSANRWLMQIYSKAVARPNSNSLYYAVYKLLPNDTDFTVFKKAGYQGLNFAYIGDVANYHTPLDNFAHVNAASLQQHGDNALAALRAFAETDIGSPPTGEAVYFDLFGTFLVELPLATMFPAAIITLALLLLTTAILIRRADVRLGEIGWSLAGLVLAYIVAAALELGLIYLGRTINPAGVPHFSAAPWVFEGTCATFAAVALLALSLALGNRVRFWSFWSANALWTASVGVLLAVKLTGGSYLAVFPAIVALIAMLLRLRADHGGRLLPEVATFGFLLVMFAPLWAIVVFLYEGLGRPGLALLTLLSVFGAAPLVGLLLLAGRYIQRLAMGIAVVVMLCGSAAAVFMPAYTVRSPQPLDIHYVVEQAGDGEARHARWLITQNAASLAPQLKQRLPFSHAHPAVFNPLLSFSQHSEFTAEAPLLELGSPTLTVTSAVLLPAANNEPARARYLVHVAPNAAVSELQIAFAPEAQVKSVTIAALGSSTFTPVTTPLTKWWGDWDAVYVVAPPSAGWDLSFESSDVPYDIDMVNVTYGLPAVGAYLQQARPADATAIQSGDDTLVATTVHIPTMPRP